MDAYKSPAQARPGGSLPLTYHVSCLLGGDSASLQVGELFQMIMHAQGQCVAQGQKHLKLRFNVQLHLNRIRRS